MLDLYVAVLEISSDGIRKKINEKINMDSVYKYDGFEFKILYCDEEFFRMSVYAYNLYTTRLLFDSLENCGRKVEGRYNVPVMIETDGGFAGVECIYILMISQKRISMEKLYQTVGIDANWSVSVDAYRALKERFSHPERKIVF